MKLSFSTRGWPGLTWDEMLETALDMGFSGVEVYNLPKFDPLLERGGPFHKYQTAATVRQLREKKLSIPCFDTSCDLTSDPEAVQTLSTLMEVAHNTQVAYVVACALQDKEDLVIEALEQLLPHAEELGVTLLLKTSGIYADTGRLRSLLDHFASDRLAALWDVHHPYRDHGESGDTTIKNLGSYVCHVHLRDSDDEGVYQLIGEGTMPIEDVMRALSSVNYDGFLSLEWKPEWLEELQDPEIIFPYFVNYMSRFHSTRDMKKSLYFNHDGTGQYIWKKDELVNLTFSQVLDRVAEEFPDQYCFKYTTLDYTRTYAQFREDVDRFARALVSMGVKAGSKVAVWATNVPAWYITFWAATKLGAVLVTVNTAYKSHEAEYLLRQSDTHTLVMIENCLDSDYRGIINELCPEIAGTKPGQPLHCKRLPFLRNVITVGFRQSGCLTFDEAMERYDLVSAEQVARMAAAVRPNDVCNMQYTSGTTGFPKGVMLTHYNVVNNGKCIGDRMGLSTADRMMIQVPMFHCFGMVLSMTSSMTHGATMCPLPYFSPKPALACIHQERITTFNGVPTMFIAMMQHEDFAKT
ncbi:MAG: AMP-binding protein, partial [Oscillospiraceae bacterium]|nr:AMP-binding protein [Oscillospiraceae bacterium]